MTAGAVPDGPDPWPVDPDPDDRYVALSDLVASGLAERICRRLGGAPLRVGQSAVVMGVASRLWSVLVVPAVRDGMLVDVTGLVARDDEGALVLGNPASPVRPEWTVGDLDAAIHQVLDPVIDELPLSERLLWGNVAASLHAVPRVHALPGAADLVAQLLARPPYAGELDLLPDGRACRRTCCLFYEVPGAGLCGDCVFDEAPEVSRRR